VHDTPNTLKKRIANVALLNYPLPRRLEYARDSRGQLISNSRMSMSVLENDCQDLNSSAI
jgi:hypothetical protein